jgi:serine/threonine-protein kinase RsbT
MAKQASASWVRWMTSVLKTERHLIRQESDVVLVRQVVRKWAAEVKFSLVEQTKIVTATSELARNTLIYGGGGNMQLEHVQQNLLDGLRLQFEDQGPGIPDVPLALKDGYTSGSGLGMGLGGAKRLVNEFEIQTKVGEGTRITITKWKGR